MYPVDQGVVSGNPQLPDDQPIGQNYAIAITPHADEQVAKTGTARWTEYGKKYASQNCLDINCYSVLHYKEI